MSGPRQVLFGFLVAFLSVLILIGALTLSLTERRQMTALPSTQTQEALPSYTRLITETQAAVDTPTPLPTKVTPFKEPASSPTVTELAVQPQPSSTPEKSAQNLNPKPTESISNHDHPYRSLLPAAFYNVAHSSSPMIIEEQPTQVVAAPTQQPRVRKPKSYCIPPFGWAVYTIRPGDTLTRLSQVTGVSIARLRQVNCMGANKKLKVGKPFFIPITPIVPPMPPSSFYFFAPPRDSRSPQPTQPVVIITLPPEAPSAALPLTEGLPSISLVFAGGLESYTTHFQRSFYVVI